MKKEKQQGSNILLRMHPLQRVALSLALAVIGFIFLRSAKFDPLFISICTWCIFALSFIITSWIIFFNRGVEQIKKYAQKEDGSRSFVILITILAALAAMVTVLLLIIDAGKDIKNEIITVPVCFLSVMLSWAMVHTILTFHYAHLYYDDDSKAPGKSHRAGLEFPNDDAPDYLDFAYFSLVVGMTFQVSDVQITDKKMRRLVLLHGLISFALNTFVVALTINFIAGLSK